MIKSQSIKFIIAGLFLLILNILFDKAYPKEITINYFSSHLLSHLAIGFIVLGTISILIETVHWTEYFEERISKLVLGHQFIEKLNTDDLKSFQLKIIQKLYKNYIKMKPLLLKILFLNIGKIICKLL